MKIARIALATVAALALVGAAQAQQFFRIGTGGTAGTYYPVGGMIANAVSQPGKLVVTAQAANGSVANVTGIAGGAIESGFTQADVAAWAYTGKGVYEGKGSVPGLRLIANLYPESVHLVVRKGSGIKSVADLKGKRVALQKGSSSHYLLIALLRKAGLRYEDITPVFLAPSDARAAFQSGAVDAWTVWDPYMGIAQRATQARVLADYTGIGAPWSFYEAQRQFADAHPEIGLLAPDPELDS